MTKFSVVIPTYNAASEIGNAIQSVQEQEYRDWELIIVDDGSTDHTADFVREYLNDERIKYLRQENKGVAVARNNGVENASGEFITFLDSDDKVTGNWLKDFNELAERSDKPGYLSCGYTLNGNPNHPKVRPEISNHKYSSLAGTFAMRRDVFQKIGGYDAQLKQSENWEMTARALEFCEKEDLEVVSKDSCNFIYQHEKSPEQTRIRDENRAESTAYLFNKYSDSGVMHFRKKEFLISSAVNFTRAGKIGKARKMFYRLFKKYPGPENLSRIIFFEIPFLRNRKWKRETEIEQEQ